MRIPTVTKRATVAIALAAATLGTSLVNSASGRPPVYAGPTPGIACDKASLPEKTQGRAPIEDVASGRAAKGYTCNATEISHLGGNHGGYRVERYVDKQGHECAFWDSTLLWPTNVPDQSTNGPGTYAVDMHDPAHPVITDVLRSPAMQSPHESVRLNQKRGLLVADMAYPTTNPGFVDVWDVSQDCLHPTLKASSPMGILGHESGFSPRRPHLLRRVALLPHARRCRPQRPVGAEAAVAEQRLPAARRLDQRRRQPPLHGRGRVQRRRG